MAQQTGSGANASGGILYTIDSDPKATATIQRHEMHRGKDAKASKLLTDSSDTSGAAKGLQSRLEALLADRPSMVEDWLADEPGTWGKLAAAGVLLERRALGRRLADAERREVWRRLWALLEARRAAGRDPGTHVRQ